MNTIQFFGNSSGAEILDRYQTLVENLPVGVYRNTSGPQGHFLEANPAIVAMFDAPSKEEFMKHNVSDFYQDPGKRQAFVEKITKQGFVKNEELELVTLKGRKFIGSVTAKMKKEPDGSVYFDGIVEDITQQRKMREEMDKVRADLEQRMKEHTEEMRLQIVALESAENVVFITDKEGVIQWINPAFTRLTGYTHDEAIGKTPRILKSGKQNQEYYARLWETILAGRSWRSEVVDRRKDGSLYVVDQTITPVKDEQGAIVHFVAIQQDITDRKRAEEEIEESKKAIMNVMEDLRFEKTTAEREKAKDEAMLDSIGDGLVVVDTDLKTMLINRAAEEKTGWSMQEARGKIWPELIALATEDGKPVQLDNWPLSMAIHGKNTTTTTTTTPYVYTRKDMSTFPVSTTVTPVKVGNEFIGAILVFRDITHERNIDKAKTEFVSLASHQLRTPLSTINWYTEMLLSGDAGMITDKQKQYLNEIYGGSRRMVELVNSLLNISRIEMESFGIEPQSVKTKELIDGILKEITLDVSTRKLHIETTYNDVESVYADPKLLRLIFQNLFANAVQYTPTGGVVSLTAVKHPPDIQFTVTDTGIGIPEAAREKIFTKLYRADNARTASPNGTGLGLYMIKSILNHAGGRIWFESQEGKGSTFYVTIPLTGMKAKAGEKGLVP